MGRRDRGLAQSDPDNTDTMRDFVKAILAVEPDATGPAVVLFEAGNTVLHAFIQSGIFALGATEPRSTCGCACPSIPNGPAMSA